jgi:hypothetical protein
VCKSSNDEIVILCEKDSGQKVIEQEIVLADRRLINENIKRLR